jgi:hydroxypyruvate reductase/glycerate 2-kinase
MREVIKEIFEAGVEAVKPHNLIQHNAFLKTVTAHKIHLFGSGKASILMAKEMEKLFKENIVGGFIVAPFSTKLEHVEVFESSHPIPSQKSIDASLKMIEKFQDLKEDDLFIYLLSGGTSALLELPLDEITLEEIIETNRLLLENGVPIEEINIVRKHLSQIKGGRLASFTKAKGVVLVISDVIGDDLESIGSAPLYLDSSTYKDAQGVLHKYKIFDKIPIDVQNTLEKALVESPKTLAENVEHIIIGSNKIALTYAKQKAEKLGLSCGIVSDSLQGDVKVVAKEIVETLLNSDKECLLFGGEPTVDVVGEGKGGRNQELCLHVLKLIKDYPNITFLSGGSDGIDGNSDAAGGVVDSSSYHDDIEEFLQNSDSYHYLKRNDDLLMIGATGTNVMDVMIIIKKS